MYSKIATKAVIACVLLVFVTVSQAAYSETDKAALVDLYTSLHGEYWLYPQCGDGLGGLIWGATKPWLSVEDPCQWCGVYCSSDRVTRLFLKNFNASGVIPTSIGNLSELSHFNIQSDASTTAPIVIGNQVTGDLPIVITTNTKVLPADLDFTNNYFTSMDVAWHHWQPDRFPAICSCKNFIRPANGAWVDDEQLCSVLSGSTQSQKCPPCYVWQNQCHASCPAGSYADIKFSPPSPAMCLPNCGNGVLNAGEECETNGANCLSTCKCATGYESTSPVSKDCTVSLTVSPLSTTNTTCATSTDGAASVSATGGSTPYTFAWSKGSSTTASATGLSAGDVTVTVTDSNGKFQTVTLHIGSPAAVSVTTSTAKNATCYGDTDGQVSATATGGSGTISGYSWATSPSATLSASATGLAAGTYTVTATDSNGCTGTATATVYQPDQLTATIDESNNVKCKGTSTGDATVKAEGGSGGYTYSWSNSATTAKVTSLAAATFTGTVTDSAGCTAPYSVTITEPTTSVSVDATQTTEVVCNGESNGVATAVATGGSGGYSYSWNKGAGNSAVATGLAADTYTVTATDSNSCEATDTVTITQPDAMFVIPSQVEAVACNGDSTGEAEAYSIGGNGGYTYAWSQGGKTGASVTGLSAGSVTVTVTDSKLCTASNATTIQQPSAALDATIDSDNVKCAGGSDGKVEVTATGGTSGYKYEWLKDSAAFGGDVDEYTDLAKGVYRIKVTDANGCTFTPSDVHITEPAAITLQEGYKLNVAIFGESTGIAEVDASAGTPGYTYSWAHDAGLTTARIENLAAGNYTVTVTDDNECTADHTFSITEPPELSLTSGGQINVLCYGESTGEAVVDADGGVAPYKYWWDTEYPSGTQGTEHQTGLNFGNHVVHVEDDEGAYATFTFHIGQSAELSVSATAEDALCYGTATGKLSATASGGNGTINFSWGTTPIATGADVDDVLAGTYTVTATDGNGCKKTADAEIKQPTGPLTLTAAQNKAAKCKGDSNGRGDSSATDGTAPYTFSWEGPTTSSSQNPTDLKAGTYNVTVVDAKGCSVSQDVVIGEPSADVSITSATQTTAVTCKGLSNGAGSVSASGGNGGFSYTWKLNGVTISTSENPSGLAAGTYDVEAKDSEECSDSTTVTITEPTAALSISIADSHDVLCYAGSSGYITAAAAGGTTPYQYAWTGVKPGSGANFTGLAEGTYNVEVTDANGCKDDTSFTLQQPGQALTITATPSDVLCNGGSTGSISSVAAGGTTPYAYSWTDNAGITTSGRSSLAYGSYTITVTDTNGCTDTDTVTVDQNAALSATTSKRDVSIAGETTGWAEVTPSGGDGDYSYSWSPAPATGNVNRVENLPIGNYTVTITDGNGCEIEKKISIVEPSALTIPDAWQENVRCYGGSTGSAHITISGGVTPYTISWNNGVSSTTEDATGLAKGTYKVTVTDANSAETDYTFDITEPNEIIVTTQTPQTHVSCFGGSTGAAAVSATGGNGTITFQWGVGGPTGASQTGLSAGTITVTATDSAGCTATHAVTTNQPTSGITVTATVSKHVTCNGASTGGLTGSANGGTNTFTSWSWNSNTFSVQNPSNVPAGTYTLTATDSNGCSANSSPVTVNQPSSLPSSAPALTTPIACFGGATGVAAANQAGGTSPLTVTWSKVGGGYSHTGSSASGLSAGTYHVDVVDNEGCHATQQTLSVVQPTSAVTATIGAPTHVKCKGQTTGSLTVSASGGTGNLNVLWSNSQTTNTITGLGASLTPYSVTVTDANGCFATDTATITEPAATLTATATPQSVTCNGGSNGAVSLVAAGGTTPYTYLWSNGPTSGSLTAVAAGTYSVTVTDANQCTATSTPVSVTQPTAVVVSITATNTSQSNAQDGSATASATGGSGTYTQWSWSPSGGSAATASGLGKGTYTVVATDSAGCTGNNHVTISDPVCTPSCLNGGVCKGSPGVCDCTGTNHFGNQCQTPFCGDGTLNNGEQCDSTGHGCVGCVCQAGWTPSGTKTCNPVCTTACQHGGVCVAPDQCNCTSATPAGGWGGAFCHEPICDPGCQNGATCIGPDQCNCTAATPSDGWTGDFCQLPVCSPACQNRGVCVAPDTCDCSMTDYFGPLCQYGVPVVSYVQALPTPAVSKRAIKGLKVAIYGLNYGSSSTGVTATIGGFPCTHLTVVSDSEIQCYVIGQGANVMTTVTVQGVSSTTNPSNNLFSEFRFDFPNLNSANSDLTCIPPYGSGDILNPEYCNCWSGSAPSNKEGTNCDAHTQCAGRTGTAGSSAQHIAIRPTHTFADDKLILKQVQPIVKNRRDTIIQFVVPSLPAAFMKPSLAIGTLGSVTCNYPGNLWEKRLNNLDCQDEYFLVMPWSQHEFCGFVEDTNPIHDTHSLRVFKSNLVTTYTETFGVNSAGIPMFRKVSNTFLLSVQFTKRIVVLTQSQVSVYIEDPTADSFLTAAITGDALYDVSSKNAIITFSTTVLWPFQLNDTFPLVGAWTKAVSNPSVGSVVAEAIASTDGFAACDGTQDSTCEQNWILTINIQPDTNVAAVCNLAGSLKFNTSDLVCRDYGGAPRPCPGEPAVDFTIKIGKTDLCDQGPAADASKGLTSVLESFYDQEYALPQTIFQTGDMIYFRVAVSNPQATIDAIAFNKLKVWDEALTTSEDLFDIAAPGVNKSDIHITQEVNSLVSPGETGYLAFNFRLLRNAATGINLINSLSSASAADAQRQLIVEATIDIWYHGNQKRTTSRVVAGPLPAVTHTTIAVYNYERTDDNVIASNNNNNVEGDEFGLWQSSASTTSVVSLFMVALLALFSLF